MFLGTCFAMTAKTTVNYINPDPKSVTLRLKDMYIDELWATGKPVAADNIEWENFPEWDYHTWMRADYKLNPKAGNNEYEADRVMYVKLKRRFAEDASSPWQTIYAQEVVLQEDFNFEIMDYIEPNKRMVEYQYVPVDYNECEYPYEDTKSIMAFSAFRNYFIVDRDKPYPAIIDAATAPNMNVPTDIVEAFGSRYPYVIRKGLTKYRSGTMTASYIEMYCCDNDSPKTHWEKDIDTGEYYEALPLGITDMENAWRYRNDVEDFIANGHPKLIKSPEGDLWLVSMTEAPSRERNGDYRYITTSFNWAEIGNALNAGDLYNAGLINTDVDAEVTL